MRMRRRGQRRAGDKRYVQNQRPVVAADVEGKRRRWRVLTMGSGGCVRSKGGASGRLVATGEGVEVGDGSSYRVFFFDGRRM
jgi:hypothetical protein